MAQVKTGTQRGRGTQAVGWMLLVAFSLIADAKAGIVVFEATGGSPADIVATRDAFRAAVGGGSVAGANGDFGGLRREINWDGVPDRFSDPNPLPGNFFNVNSPRGAVFSTPGTGFLVSSNPGTAVPPLFGFPGDLQTFSPQRLFASVGSNITDVTFFVPGTAIRATTSAFAAIFVDEELDENATLMEFFDQNDALIFSRSVLEGANQSLAFLGGAADSGERIGRVRITTPNNFLLSNGSRLNEDTDFVVMDDFLYATPVAVPEPATWGVLAVGSLSLLAFRRRAQASSH